MRVVENVTHGDFVPASSLIDSQRITLTERGVRLVALLRCHELLPASSTTIATVLNRRIDEMLGDVDLAD